jgi:hypothetical protein
MIFRLKSIFFSVGLLLICALNHHAAAQSYVQYSGVIVTADSMKPISFATAYDITNGNGIYANYQGFFSLVVSPGDSVVFTSIGFIKHYEVIPVTLTNADKYSSEIKLEHLSYNLPATTVYPYPTKDQFIYAFTHLNIPDDNLARAKKNLNKQTMLALERSAPADPEINHIKLGQQYSQKLYYIGQYEPISLLDPFAWAQFFEAIKNGDLKSQPSSTQSSQPSEEPLPPIPQNPNNQ